MLPTTVARVPRHTSAKANRGIQRATERNVARYCAASPDEIQQRLDQLDAEWDIERTLEANAATAALVGLGLGAFVHRRFFALPAVVAGFLLQHAIQGWCPPVPVFRRLGFRTQPEIEQERFALKALRGDFAQLSDGCRDPAVALSAVRQ
jgi:hypothetical protein